MAASNPKATYDLGLGTIQRGNNHPDAYEVPAQWWADLTDTSGAFGAAVLNDSKYGWDKPADHVLRLTLLHTPKAGEWPRPFYQSSQDLGRHRFVYSLAGHQGDWRAGSVPMRAARLNQPLIAFQSAAHSGGLGRVFSLASISDTSGQVAVRALKKAEDRNSDEIVVRLQELYGRPVNTQLTFSRPITAAREINAAEEPVGPATVAGGALDIRFAPYQPRTFALQLARPAPGLTDSVIARIQLPFNLDGISLDSGRGDGNLDGHGQTIAGELWPDRLSINGVPFTLGSSSLGALNVMVPDGQTLRLPRMPRMYMLAAAVGGDVATTLEFETASGRQSVPITIREWQAPIGQWYSTIKTERMLREVVVPEMQRQTWTERAIADDMVTTFDPKTGAVSGIADIRPAFVKTDEIAWVGTHRHAPAGDQIYVPSYVFLYGFDLPADVTSVRLPVNKQIRIFAITALTPEPKPVTPAGPLYTPEIPRR
jgi:alpha-mannosidase